MYKEMARKSSGGVNRMKIIEQSAEILDKINGEEILKKIELAGRTCYHRQRRACGADAAPASKLQRGKHEILQL